MLILNYTHPQSFPYGVRPSLPEGILNLVSIRDKLLTLQFQTATPITLPYSSCWFWPALVALEAIELPQVLAHFAIWTGSFGPGGYYFSPRAWIELTNRPEDQTSVGIPLCIRNDSEYGKPCIQVECLWHPDGETYTAYDRLADATATEQEFPPEFWRNYFVQVLVARRNKAEEELARAVNAATRMQLILAAIDP